MSVALQPNSNPHSAVACGDDPSFYPDADRPVSAGNLLVCPVFSARLVSGEAVLTLPGILAACATGDLVDLPAVRAHQAHTVHMFLSQLYALGLEAAGDDADITREATWREALLGIEPGRDARLWDIVGASDDAPAFLQPPVPAGLKLKEASRSPSSVDLLVTANAHVTKPLGSFGHADEIWLWHLVTLQTGAGFPGRGNYGAFRMNGGFSSRPLFAVYDESWTFGRRVAEDAALVNSVADRVRNDYGFTRALKLMWARDWPENEVLTVSDLDPRVIEICRRVRFSRDDASLVAHIGNSALARTDLAKAFRGDVGDVWAPVVSDKDGLKSLSVMGLTYGQIAKAALGVGGEIRASLATRRRVENGVLVAAGVANGQGKTEGFYRREIPFRSIADMSGWGDAEIPEGVSGVADTMIREARKAINALRAGISMHVAGGPVALSKNDAERGNRAAEPYVERLSSRIDEVFFRFLNERVVDDDGARLAFARDLHEHARRITEIAIEALPVNTSNRHRVRNRARNMFGDVFFSKPKSGDVSFDDLRADILKGADHE